MSDRWLASPEEPARLEHVYQDAEGTWRTSGGFVQAASEIFDSINAVHSMHWFAQHQGGRQYTVLEHDAGDGTLTLAYVNYSSPTVEAIQTGRQMVYGPTPGTTYFDHAGWVYVLNGYDRPVRWNGERLVDVGFGRRPAPPLVSISGYDQADANYGTAPDEFNNAYQRGVGAQQDASDARANRYVYGYATTEINDLGHESPLSEIVWVRGRNTDSASATRGVGSINVELARSAKNVMGKRIWRTVNVYDGGAVTGAPVYLVAEFGTGGRIHYVDDSPDHELILQYDPTNTGVWPARAKYATLFKHTLFVDDGSGNLRYSAPGFIEQMPASNYLVLGDSKAGPVMGLKATKNALVAFKRRGIYLVRGDPSSGFQVETLTEDIGLAAPRSIVEVPRLGVIFLAEDGPYLLVGALEDTGTPTTVQFIGGQVAKFWRREVNRKALEAVRATRYAKDREVWFSMPVDGDDRPSTGLIFHYQTGGWSLRPGFPFSALAEARDHRGLLFGGSWDTSATAKRGVHVYTRGATTLGGDGYTSEIRSPWLRTGERSRPERLEIRSLNIGRSVTVQTRIDRAEESWTSASDSSWSGKDYERSRDTWGSGVWDTATWAPTVPVELNVPVYENAALEFQWRITSKKLAVAGYEAIFVGPTDIVKRGVDV